MLGPRFQKNLINTVILWVAIHLAIGVGFTAPNQATTVPKKDNAVTTTQHPTPALKSNQITLTKGEIGIDCEEITYEMDGKKITAKTKVVVQYKGVDYLATLNADTVEMDLDEHGQAKEIVAFGDQYVKVFYTPYGKKDKNPTTKNQSKKKNYSKKDQKNLDLPPESMTITAKKCTYLPSKGMITCDTDVVVTKKEDVIKGDRLEVDMVKNSYKMTAKGNRQTKTAIHLQK